MGLIKQASLRNNEEHFSQDIMFHEQLEFAIVNPDLIKDRIDDETISLIVWELLIPSIRDTLLFKHD